MAVLKLCFVIVLFCVPALISSSLAKEISVNNNLTVKRQEFIKLLGDLPYRKNIDVKEFYNEKLPGYNRKLIQYVIQDDTITAYVLIPFNIIRKVPGILAIHQDGEHRPYEFGKGEPAGVNGDSSLFYGQELCLKGNVVICPDRSGFESRMLRNTRFWKDYKNFQITLDYYGEKINLTEDLYLGAKASNYLIQGKTLLGVTLAELMFAVDYLCSLKEVDTTKIGVIGHSAGGFLTSVLMYIDNRIKAGVSSCGSFLISDIYSLEYLRPMNGFLGLLTIPGIKKWGDFDDIIAGIYPRSFLELSADIDRSKVFDKVNQLQINEMDKFRIHHNRSGNRIKHIFYKEGKHTFRKDMREEAYRWLDNRLNED